MKYTDQDKIDILNKVLKQYGLSFDDYEVDYFFNRTRTLEPVLEEYSEEGKQEFAYSQYIRPTTKKLLPSDFENSTYGTDRTLLDWYMYRNWNERTLVWENVGNANFDVKTSFLNDRNRYSKTICQDIRGNIFNKGDGNHRLVILIINHFLEKESAKSPEEKLLIDKKYEMELDVSLPFSKELYELLNNEFINMKKNNSNLAIRFREESYENFDESKYFVMYDETTKIFNYSLNGETFSGTEQEMINFLKTKKQKKDPIMTWEADGVFYVSCGNTVWKSKNKDDIVELLPKINQAYQGGVIEILNILEIKDIEKNTYEIRYPSVWVEDKNLAMEIASSFKTIFWGQNEKTFFDKLEDVNYWRTNLPENINKAYGFFGGVSIPDLAHLNLTKDEFRKLRQMYIEFDKVVQNAQNQELST